MFHRLRASVLHPLQSISEKPPALTVTQRMSSITEDSNKPPY